MKTHAILRGLLFLAFAVATSPWVHTQNSQPATAQTQPSSQQAAPPSPSAAPLIPPYPDTAKGLESLMKDMLKLSKGKDHDEMARYAKSLVLPDPDNWFKSVFGEKLGPQLATASERARMETEMSAPDFLARVRSEKLSEVQAVRFDEECNPLATDAEFPFLARRVRFDPLYDVRFRDSKKQLVWAYFAYVDGGFRYIGTLALANAGPNYEVGKSQPSSQAPAQAPQSGPRRLKVGGPVQQAQLLTSCEATPVYPEDAKYAGVSGTVLLHVIVGTDGEVHDLQPISGPPMLIPAAMNAVRRWRYRPTLWDGEPAEVDTMISVVFTLAD